MKGCHTCFDMEEGKRKITKGKKNEIDEPP